MTKIISLAPAIEKIDTTRIVLPATNIEKLEEARQYFSIKQKLFSFEPLVNYKFEATTQIMLKLKIENPEAKHILPELKQISTNSRTIVHPESRVPELQINK